MRSCTVLHYKSLCSYAIIEINLRLLLSHAINKLKSRSSAITIYHDHVDTCGKVSEIKDNITLDTYVNVQNVPKPSHYYRH